MRTAYLAPREYAAELRTELGAGVVSAHGRLLIADGPPRPVTWAHNVWYDPVEIPIRSITDGARKLRELQRNWALYSFLFHRRAALMEAELPHVGCKPLRFPEPVPDAQLGSWTLLDRDRILAAPRCSSPFRHGHPSFVEDRTGPPNRAYLKLWELFTLLGRRPRPGDGCVDLGASPGGWTWVLAHLGARVVAVDRAPLDERVRALPGVEERRESAFGVEPFPVDWMFCDVACYPARLLTLVNRWLPFAKNLVCTVKLQGPTDPHAADPFAAIPGTELRHLWHNRHELTLTRLEPFGPSSAQDVAGTGITAAECGTRAAPPPPPDAGA
jgi:23S rRNA (cytidine2498-2'-O)-methyltransferase